MDIKAPYGSWPSPISAELLTDSAVALADVVVDDGDLYWSESRPHEDGRTAIVSRNTRGDVADVTPDGFNSRSRVHEYGGGSYVVREGIVVSCSFQDQRVYRTEDSEAVPSRLFRRFLLATGTQTSSFTTTWLSACASVTAIIVNRSTPWSCSHSTGRQGQQ